MDQAKILAALPQLTYLVPCFDRATLCLALARNILMAVAHRCVLSYHLCEKMIRGDEG